MGIRETLKNNPRLGAGLGIGALVLGIAFIVQQTTSLGGPSNTAFFSVDDGQSWFEDDAEKIPPFMHDGKEAVRAYVFECNGKKFVNHLERYSEERRQLIAASAEATKNNQPPPRPPAAAGQNAMWGIEIKKPGDKQWTAASNLARSGPMLQAKCPDGSDATPVEP